MKTVTILNNGLETGDWWILKVDDVLFYEGHSISPFIWMALLEYCGIPCDDKRDLTNEQLENER